jgi:hypothetical protein
MTERAVPDLAAAAEEVLHLLDGMRLPACLIGALAVHRWGEPRATADVDLTVLAPYGEDGQLLDALFGRFTPRRTDARAFALAQRVALIRASGGVPVAVALAAFPFELEVLDRGSPWQIVPGVTVRTCSAEDLILYKLVAARPRDLIDVDSIVRRQQHRLDVERIRRWGRELAELKDDPELLRPFEDALRRIGPG